MKSMWQLGQLLNTCEQCLSAYGQLMMAYVGTQINMASSL